MSVGGRCGGSAVRISGLHPRDTGDEELFAARLPCPLSTHATFVVARTLSSKSSRASGVTCICSRGAHPRPTRDLVEATGFVRRYILLPPSACFRGASKRFADVLLVSSSLKPLCHKARTSTLDVATSSIPCFLPGPRSDNLFYRSPSRFPAPQRRSSCVTT